MTQDGATLLIENTLRAKEVSARWQQVSLVLAEALSSLDFHDVDDVVPYSVAQEVEDAVRAGDIDKLCVLLNTG